MFSAARLPRNSWATPCCMAAPLMKQPVQNSDGNDGSVGATTMLLVCWASDSASFEYQGARARKPCWR